MNSVASMGTPYTASVYRVPLKAHVGLKDKDLEASLGRSTEEKQT